MDQIWLLVSPPLRQRSTKQRSREQKSTELNICLHNVRSIRNKTKDVNALLEVNEISLGVFIEARITNNSDDDFILKQCCPSGFLSYSAPRVNKRGGGICVFYRYDIHLENFEKFTSEYFECCYASLTVGATRYLVIAVCRPTGLNVKSFIDHFTVIFEEKRLQFDKVDLLGDFNISLNVNNDASKMWNSFFEDYGLTQYVSEKTQKRVGFLTILLRQTIFQLMLNRIASLLLWTIRLFVSRSAVWNNANLNNVWCIEIGRSLTLMVLLSYSSRASSSMLSQVLMKHGICI